jgi:hypothetical protein
MEGEYNVRLGVVAAKRLEAHTTPEKMAKPMRHRIQKTSGVNFQRLLGWRRAPLGFSGESRKLPGIGGIASVASHP